MPRYFYKCPSCSHEYLEQRGIDESQFFTKCNSCGQSDYEEVSSEE